MEGFTIIDGVVALVIVVSALLAYSRGIVREAMAILGWVGAAVVAFLLADEVGLGKTIVTQDVIRQQLEAKGTLRVVYFACNLDIARQNRKKLIPKGEEDSSGAKELDRLTLNWCCRRIVGRIGVNNWCGGRAVP